MYSLKTSIYLLGGNQMLKIKRIVITSALAVMTIGTTALASGFGGFRLPVYNGYNYLGSYSKSNPSNKCVYFQVDKLSYTEEMDAWVTDSNAQKSQISDDYYFRAGERKNMYQYRTISSGYVGGCNRTYSGTSAYVDGWVNFN